MAEFLAWWTCDYFRPLPAPMPSLHCSLDRLSRGGIVMPQSGEPRIALAAKPEPLPLSPADRALIVIDWMNATASKGV